jgi:hypothetical protein
MPTCAFRRMAAMTLDPRTRKLSELEGLVRDLSEFADSDWHKGSEEDLSDRERFRSLLSSARDILKRNDRELARELVVPTPTISRWVRGETSPHSVFRRAYLRALAKAGQQRLALAYSYAP